MAGQLKIQRSLLCYCFFQGDFAFAPFLKQLAELLCNRLLAASFSYWGQTISSHEDA